MTLYVAWVEHCFYDCAKYSISFAVGMEQAVCYLVDQVSAEGECVVRTGGFRVKAVVSLHDLSHLAPMCIATRIATCIATFIDLSQRYCF